jgi:hypothetical protein
MHAFYLTRPNFHILHFQDYMYVNWLKHLQKCLSNHKGKYTNTFQYKIYYW